MSKMLEVPANILPIQLARFKIGRSMTEKRTARTKGSTTRIKDIERFQVTSATVESNMTRPNTSAEHSVDWQKASPRSTGLESF